MADFPYKSPPMDHQLAVLRRAFPLPHFAIFHEMGLGKAYTVINLAAARFMKEQIEAVLIVCGNGDKPVWTDDQEGELALWYPGKYYWADFIAGSNTDTLISLPRDRIKWLITSYQSMSPRSDRAYKEILKYVKSHRTMIVLDESDAIKTWTTNRTERLVEIGSWCPYKIIMTGTEITQGVEDLFAQYAFLDPSIIGCVSPMKKQPSFRVFKARYCMMGGYQGRKIMGYVDTDVLFEKLKPFTDVALKKDVMDLPPKIYERTYVNLSKVQLAAIEQLKRDFETEVSGRRLTTKMELDRLTRYQQIIGGTYPFNHDEDGNILTDEKGRAIGESIPIPGTNPKLERLMELIEKVHHEQKIIIWARFVPEIQYIIAALSELYGSDSYVTYYGATSDDDRIKNKRSFSGGGGPRFFVANRTASRGLTLNICNTVFYYSNSFSYGDRRQSEDRNHRKGQLNSVVYTDIIANHEWDKLIHKALARKESVAMMFKDEMS